MLKDWERVQKIELSESKIVHKRSSPNRFGNELQKNHRNLAKINSYHVRFFAIETLTDPASNTQQNAVDA
jgi:hypothetical protein